MRQLSLLFVSVVTLGLMGVVALVFSTSDPGSALVPAWALALVLAALTLWYGIETSLQSRQLAWFGGLLAAGVIGLLGLVVTFLILVYPALMLGSIRLDHLIDIVPFLPACAGLVGLVYSFFLRAPSAPSAPAHPLEGSGASRAYSPPTEG